MHAPHRLASLFTMILAIGMPLIGGADEAAPASDAAEAGDWQILSENLDGWRAEGGAWQAEDGVIHGTAARGENAWLIYEPERFADFELTVEWRTQVPTNGGVQFRSHWLPRMPLEEGETVESAPRLMYGYQANVETRQRTASGRLIDENGRGPLAETPLEAAKTLSQRGWNTMRIVARGAVIEIYLGDVLAHHTEDEAYLDGSLALQVFGFEALEEETTVEYRNLRVRRLEEERAWQPLLQSDSLEGWEEYGSEKWTVSEGVLTGASGAEASEGYLATEARYADFRARGRFKLTGGEGNYGLFFHSSIELRDDGYPMISGIQTEVEPQYPGQTGWFYESYGRQWLIEPAPQTMRGLAMRPDAWNDVELRVQDGRYTSWINGIRVAAFEDPAEGAAERSGQLALQLHTGGAAPIQWKDLAVSVTP